MKRHFLISLFLFAFFSFAAGQDDNKLPKPDPAFNGTIDTRDNSKADWPQRPKAHAGAPNVVLILLDDVGFGATSVFGGPIDTPGLQQLADSGLRYNRFHVNALCSPTRAALLSGRNSHQMGFGNIAELAAGYPGYNSVWPKESASVAEVLKENGYSTAAFGKWHNTPMWEINAAGPFDRWPTGLGFEYFYGFMSAQTSQWEPTLYRNTLPVDPLAARHAGEHLTTDLVDDAIGWVHRHDALASEKPFFLYFATGATHVPHHVPEEWIAKYKGKFDEGWDVLRQRTFERQKQLGVIPAGTELTPRPKEMPAWDSLTADQKKLVTRQMEVYAGFLAQTDYEVGRLLAGIRADGHNEDTIVFYIPGDNGSSAEGTLEGRDGVNIDGKAPSVTERLEKIDDLGSELFLNHFATAWAWSLNTPFQWAKEVASHLGGTRDPLIVSWPGHITQAGGIRSQFTHINDVAPTIYELASITPPAEVNGIKQTPLEGVSFAYTFDHPDAPGRHKTQYFEMLGSRGIYKDGWWAGSFDHIPWPTEKSPFNSAPEPKPWELYHLDEDFSQAHNLAAQYPDKVKELEALFDSEAKRNHAYPLEPLRNDVPFITNAKTSFVYRSGQQPIPAASAPRVSQRGHVITAELNIPTSGATGAIVVEGGRYGGFTLYAKSGSLIYESNVNGHRVGQIVSSERLSPGNVTVAVAFTPDNPVPEQTTAPLTPPRLVPGVITLSINDKAVGSGHIPGIGNNTDTFDIGYDRGSPVSASYTSPFAFSGVVESLRVDLK
ncbi:MAG TPA: arylsulfatase [Candidatus Sulfotelmatobacter sp.]